MVDVVPKEAFHEQESGSMMHGCTPSPPSFRGGEGDVNPVDHALYH